ncbi:hypothetical protein LWI29_000461 [Acer saccharum]|uniref:Endonuclease/exonuclease/phosphatase domain-containing protein n=1 Tax=Acer saccharum TaxID=4024 RepID=A0AA39S6N6_ACESA|nr:hypothetical protein LWI29_000461 [Acer saccharum]
MKRFFKPIEKDGSAKKPALSPAKKETENEEENKKKREPLKFLTWNANSLLLRVKNNWPDFSNFVTTFDPDVIAIQEVRMPAAGSKGAPKNPGELKDDTGPSREEKRCSEKPLIWCGDLNVSHEEIDVSHPDFFSAAKLNGYIPPNKEDCGQPGFTLSERKRFGALLKEGRLLDAYRFLHKEKDMDCGFSWSGNPIGKYRGKRMRIDYFVVSEELKDRIAECEMRGRGIELEGFYGSDHCPVSFELSPQATPDSNQGSL